MPPKRKFNKRNQIAKKQLTSRLMTLSLLVEKYIYKNKQISVPQAQTYLEELISLKSQCLGDAPSLQVCEKLTRCMKGIIEEQSNDAVLEDTESCYPPSYPYAASPVYSLPDEDKTLTCNEPDVQPTNDQSNYIFCNNNNGKNFEGIQHTSKDKKTVRFHMDVDEEYCDESLKTINLNDGNLHTFNESRACNVDNELTDVMLDLTLEDIDQPINSQSLCSQSLLKNVETVRETCENVNDYSINDTCGQDMNEFNREITNLIEPQLQSCLEHNKHSLIHESQRPITQNTPVLIKNIFGNKPEPIIKQKTSRDHPIRNKKNEKKPPIEIKQKKIIPKKKNKENKPEIKHKAKKTVSKLAKKNASRQTFTPLTNYLEKTQKPSGNTDDKINSASNIGKEIGSKNISNVVKKPATHFESNRSNNFAIDTSPKNVMCIEEDLSWVENLKYVREIHLGEYDAGYKLSESFWDNSELPGNWDIRDFDLS